jgi:hypothetical protein
MLGGALAGQQEYIAAEPLLLEGYEGLNSHETEIPPQAKARLAEAFERVVELYEATGQNDKSAEFRRRFLGK